MINIKQRDQKTFTYSGGTEQEAIVYEGVDLKCLPIIISFPVTGSASFEVTCSSKEDILNGTAVWVSSPYGNINASKIITMCAVPTAFRIVRNSGTVRIDICVYP
jgi:hypothetical protein